MTRAALRTRLRDRNPAMTRPIVRMSHDEFWRFYDFVFEHGERHGREQLRSEWGRGDGRDLPDFMKGLFR